MAGVLREFIDRREFIAGAFQEWQHVTQRTAALYGGSKRLLHQCCRTAAQKNKPPPYIRCTTGHSCKHGRKVIVPQPEPSGTRGQRSHKSRFISVVATWLVVSRKWLRAKVVELVHERRCVLAAQFVQSIFLLIAAKYLPIYSGNMNFFFRQ